MSSRRRWNPEFREDNDFVQIRVVADDGAAAGSTTYVRCASGERRRSARSRG